LPPWIRILIPNSDRDAPTEMNPDFKQILKSISYVDVVIIFHVHNRGRRFVGATNDPGELFFLIKWKGDQLVPVLLFPPSVMCPLLWTINDLLGFRFRLEKSFGSSSGSRSESGSRPETGFRRYLAVLKVKNERQLRVTMLILTLKK
jgi:hypothetical protein